MEIPTDKFGLARRASIVGTHTSDKVLRGKVASKELHRLWPGAMADFAAVEQLDDVEKHRLTVIAAAKAGDPNRIFSHVSAAAMHRLPLLWPDLTRVHVASPKVGKLSARVVRHQGAVDPEDVEVVDGVTVTSIERTACDVARLGTSRQALVVLDAALRMKADAERMQAILESCRRFKGVEMLRRMLPHANVLSESVGESLSRAVMLDFSDLPVPQQQVRIVDDRGEFIARVDFLLADKVIGEFDGLVKYKGTFDGKPAWQTVVDEKIREDKLRAQGYTVVRWTWQDLRDEARFHATLLKALRGADVA
ncbi:MULTISPECIES: type IV toxin-antitoxin system AbiEi family antitoxin domain-containing protein [Gordonia]|uniref:DUF559 domain-containing protein n=1 Tax=Gordonia alkanivorans CGMCC 6845 TaxID=1423140 RepID=W9DCJ6_9ACTN|nr:MULTISPECIES: hypothetical protein [Gordonia]ETA06137.1 hypothetical protein V525_14755 [Gordonia alkanivorans CGMCC 6845]MDH3010552.1 hypothetical protein [Gordonia alkanivorans]MDH3021424.1 hypothetical protein [Gordonia alkanivorans]MDH3025228.1 hypothetical protein [Gordonia alkanivorans]MDH3050953.1 hypothetical protein [Gordonia alkanivorans]